MRTLLFSRKSSVPDVLVVAGKRVIGNQPVKKPRENGDLFLSEKYVTSDIE